MQLLPVVTASLEDIKALNVVVIDIAHTSVADHMIICTGRSQRHVKSIADRVALAAKEAGHPAIGVEGDKIGDWVLLDLGDIIVHVMLQEVRDYYQLEKLWQVEESNKVESV